MDDKTKKIDELKGDVWGDLRSKAYSVRIKQDNAVLANIELKEGENLIGRMPENDIMIDDPEVSRSHARILLKGETGELMVEDLQSENGVLVNGKKVQIKEVKVGDAIRIGGHDLVIVEADQFSYKPELDDQIEKAKAQEWRLDQTVAASTPELQREIAEKIMKGKKTDFSTISVVSEEEQEKIIERIGAQKEDRPKAKIPSSEITVSLAFGDKVAKAPMKFDFVREADPAREKSLEDAIYINLKIGNLIFGKKIKL